MKRLIRRFQKRERGFTLIELLIVIAILGVLAAVVVPNVMGLFGRGGNQAYGSDAQTIQTSVASFYGDVHREPAGSGVNWCWGNATGATKHIFPTCNGTASDIEADTAGVKDSDNSAADAWILYVDRDSDGDYDAPGEAASDNEVLYAAIWMGLLVNEADGYSATDDADAQTAAAFGNTTVEEDSMYLTDFPKSASLDNGNPDPGTYTWIVGKNGRVYGAYENDGYWYSGFSGNYP